MKFSVVVLTYKREEDLRKCLESIKSQTLLPDELFVLDDDLSSEEFINNQRDGFEDLGVKFIYYKKDHSKAEESQGSSTSRDLGIKLSRNEAVFILDDDLILDPDYFENSMKAWEDEDNEKMIGVGGLIKNERDKTKLEKIFNKIFGLTSKNKWDVNDVGFQTWDQTIKERERGYYMHGGACVYKKKPTQEFKFSIFSGGRTGLIDPDFSLRAKKKGYYFIIEPRAKAIHNHSSSGRESSYISGLKEGRNRKIIFKENCDKNIKNYIWFFWANVGWILRQFLTKKFKKGMGMIQGFLFPVPKPKK